MVFNPIKYMRGYILTRKIERADIIRRKGLHVFIGPQDNLPYGVWEHYVKKRAGFRCEDCGKRGTKDKALHAHHILAVEMGGKNTLENGKCVCSRCHGKYRTKYPIENRTHRALNMKYGYVKGTEMYNKFKQEFEQADNSRKSKMLDEILNNKLREVAGRKKKVPLSVLKSKVTTSTPSRDFRKAISSPRKINIIAEIKRASPSAGVIIKNFFCFHLAISNKAFFNPVSISLPETTIINLTVPSIHN